MFYTNVFAHKNHILHRYIDDQGKRQNSKVSYRPTLFTIANRDTTGWHTIDGQPLLPVQHDSIWEARQFIKTRGPDNVYGSTSFAYTFINEFYGGTHNIRFDLSKLRVINFDIEVDTRGGMPNIRDADKMITAITIQYNTNKFVAFSYKDYNPEDSNITYIKCDNEAQLLERFIATWRHLDPDIVTGWNIDFFDIPYLIGRINRVIGEDRAAKLSPWEIVDCREIFVAGRPHDLYRIRGVNILDYMELYKKYGYKQQESYKLDNVAADEIGETKVDYGEYKNLHTLYEQNFKLFMDYNIHDTRLVLMLDQKRQLINLACVIAYLSKVNVEDVFGAVKLWDTRIHNYLWSNQIAVPQTKGSTKDQPFSGAYVKDPQVGKHKWIASFDINSLYPHLIMQYNIGPDTLAGRATSQSVDEFFNRQVDMSVAIEKDCCVAASGIAFTNTKVGFLPTLMEETYTLRKHYQKLMKDEKDSTQRAVYDNTQMALKILLNSAYGGLGNAGFRFYDIRFAESITLGGQLAIRWVSRDVNNFLNQTLGTENVDYIIANDTDSMYVALDSIVKAQCQDQSSKLKIVDWVDNFCNEVLQPIIEQSFESLAKYTNARSNRLVMKREVIADVGIWTSKKHYILGVVDKEGKRSVDKPQLKVMGVEAVKTSTPAACRNAMRDAFPILLYGTQQELWNYIDVYRERFASLPFVDIAFPRTCNGLIKYHDPINLYKIKTPKHVRGALLYNKLLEDYKIVDFYEPIVDGQKVRFCQLKQPNPIFSDVISCPDHLPSEFNLQSYIDHEGQLTKAMLNPLQAIATVMGWKVEKTATLEGLFIE